MKIRMALSSLLFWTASIYGQNALPNHPSITAVSGESWLHHLHRPFDETSMGKTWRLGPAIPDAEQVSTQLQRTATSYKIQTESRTHVLTLRGADLYRFNCQGCHGESGLGAPPEIRSLINPVRASSAALIVERMKNLGMTISRRQATELAAQSQAALLKRLHEGGQDMPSFQHLTESEIGSLLAYLNQLAGVPGAEKEQVAIREPQERVGELIAKSTCHICHGAAGTNPTAAELMEGAIPPLSALPLRVNQAQLVRKVTRGAPVMMGTPSSAYRGRMPVFDYLSEEEAANVYQYLVRYPPTEVASFRQAIYTTLPDADASADFNQPQAAAPQAAPSSVLDSREEPPSLVLPFGFASLAIALLALGCWITLREFRRLARNSSERKLSLRPEIVSVKLVTPRRKVETGVDRPSTYVERKIS